MLYKISGELEKIILSNKAIIKTPFFSLEVFLTLKDAERLKDFLNKKVELYTVFILKNGEIPQVYGFIEEKTREVFFKLMQTSFLGVNLSLKILSVFTVEELSDLIKKGNWEELERVPGIGKKRAEKIFLEIKDSLSSMLENISFSQISQKKLCWEKLEEVLEAMVGLGFKKKEVIKRLEELVNKENLEALSKEELLKKLLRSFSRR